MTNLPFPCRCMYCNTGDKSRVAYKQCLGTIQHPQTYLRNQLEASRTYLELCFCLDSAKKCVCGKSLLGIDSMCLDCWEARQW